MIIFRENHEKRDYASDLIKSSTFKDKNIEQIFEIFIYYEGKDFKKKHYRKDKPIWIGEPNIKTLEKTVQERDLISLD